MARSHAVAVIAISVGIRRICADVVGFGHLAPVVGELLITFELA
jgi:hypothetical protein